MVLPPGTGAAYGLLLDQFLPSWRSGLNSSFSFSEVMLKYLQISDADREKRLTRIEVIADSYGGSELFIRENNKLIETEIKQQDYIEKFTKKNVLILPLFKIKMSFDPDRIFSLKPFGTVYPSITIIDKWGKITVNSGALLSSDFSKLLVPITQQELKRATLPNFHGEGWQVELNPGW